MIWPPQPARCPARPAALTPPPTATLALLTRRRRHAGRGAAEVRRRPLTDHHVRGTRRAGRPGRARAAGPPVAPAGPVALGTPFAEAGGPSGRGCRGGSRGSPSCQRLVADVDAGQGAVPHVLAGDHLRRDGRAAGPDADAPPPLPRRRFVPRLRTPALDSFPAPPRVGLTIAGLIGACAAELERLKSSPAGLERDRLGPLPRNLSRKARTAAARASASLAHCSPSGWSRRLRRRRRASPRWGTCSIPSGSHVEYPLERELLACSGSDGEYWIATRPCSSEWTTLMSGGSFAVGAIGSGNLVVSLRRSGAWCRTWGGRFSPRSQVGLPRSKAHLVSSRRSSRSVHPAFLAACSRLSGVGGGGVPCACRARGRGRRRLSGRFPPRRRDRAGWPFRIAGSGLPLASRSWAVSARRWARHRRRTRPRRQQRSTNIRSAR